MPNALKTLYGGIEMNVNENQKDAVQSAKKSPIKNKIGNVFIPVRDIEKAREWYCKLLGLNPDCEIMLGHLCPLPMEGAGVILDTMPMWGGKEPGGAPNLQTPAFMFMTTDLQASYNYAIENNVTLVTDIQHDKWFVIKDPDDNMLMICKE
jgi:catechol 2,3-dioxygenase-like lactoylglutathione lyase family enzyme